MTNDLIFVSLLCSFIIGTLVGACALWLCVRRCRCEPGGGASSRSAVAPLRLRPPPTAGGGAPVAPDRS
jgi:hypothetical protein